MLKDMAKNKLQNMADPNAPAETEEDYYGHPVAPSALELWDDIQRHGLAEHVGELEVLGYTVIPPEKVASQDFTARLREKILDVAERRTGVRPDIENPQPGVGTSTAFGDLHYGMVLEDPVFEEAIQNPAVLTLVTYLCGKNAVLTTGTALIKAAGEEPLALHCDFTRMAAPYPPHAQAANATWLFTDYSFENGSICYVPGSHRYCRPPLPREGLSHRRAVDAPAGSIVLHSSHTWHGAFPRSAPGLRVSMSMTYVRPYVKPYETLRETVSAEALERNPKRFATLMGQDTALSFGREGPDPRYGPESFAMGRHVYD